MLCLDFVESLKSRHQSMLDSMDKQLIRQWNSQWADTEMRRLFKKHRKNYFKASKEFIDEHYCNIIVDSVIGHVEFDNGKLLDDLTAYHALAIARIPEILIFGKSKPSPLTKKRTDFIKFIIVEKVVAFERGGEIKRVRVSLHVGVRKDDKKLAYVLDVKKQKNHQSQFDKLDTTKQKFVIAILGVDIKDV